MKKYTIDRFEGELAVLLPQEDESVQVDVLREQLPSEIEEGDILEVELNERNEVVTAKLLKKETKSARQKADDLLKNILNKNK